MVLSASDVFLGDYYSLLVMLRLLATLVLVGAMTHSLRIVLRYVRARVRS